MNKEEIEKMLNVLDAFSDMSKIGLKGGVSTALLYCLVPVIFMLINSGTQKLVVGGYENYEDAFRKLKEVLDELKTDIDKICSPSFKDEQSTH